MSPTVSLFCPFEQAVHPNVEAIEAGAARWVERFELSGPDGVPAQLIAGAIGEATARFLPAGIGERVQAVANWVYWAVAFDDLWDSDRADMGSERFAELAVAYQRVVDTPAAPVGGDPFAHALYDVVESFRRWATPAQLRRWTDAFRGWLLGVAHELAVREHERMPSLDGYLRMRRYAVAGQGLMMIEMVHDLRGIDDALETPMMRAMVEASSMVIALDNDLISYAKERRDDRLVLNVVDVLRAADPQLAPEDAFAVAQALRDRILGRFLELRDRLGAGAAELRRYADVLGQGQRGMIDWGTKTARYRASSPEQVTDIVLTDVLSGVSREPPECPSIAWWWEVA